MGKEIINALAPDSLQANSWYPEYLQLLGQCLAWSYLTDTGQISEGLHFPDSNICSATEVLSEQLQQISTFRKDPVWQSAWMGYGQFLRAVPSLETERLITSLTTARRHGLLQYDELAEALYKKQTGLPATLPGEIQDLMLQLLPVAGGEQIYLPGLDSYSLAIRLAGNRHSVFCEDTGHTPGCAVSSLLNDRIHLAEGDPVLSPAWLQQGTLKTFDRGLGVLLKDHRYKVNEVRDLYGRFDTATRQREMLLITHMLKQCSGDFVLAIPGSCLKKNTAAHISFRRKLLENGRLNGVIRLPAGLLPGRAQPLFLMLFGAAKADRVRFINCDSDYFKGIALKRRGGAKIKLNHHDVILEQYQELSNPRVSYQAERTALLAVGEGGDKFMLDPADYLGENRSVVVRDMAANTNPLSLEFDILRAQAIKASDNERARDGKMYMEITVNDINEAGQVESPQRSVYIAGSGLKRASSQQLQAGDILLVIKGQAGKLALVPDICGSNWIASQSFVILRQKSGNTLKSPVVLFRFLKSETGKKLLTSICAEGSVPFIHSNDLKNLPIPRWSDLEQEQACRSHSEVLKLYARMRFFREKAELIEREILKEA